MASRFYSLIFIALTGVLGMVSLPDLTLMMAQAQINQDRKAEADRLFEQGLQQWKISHFEASVQSYQQALNIYQEIKDRQSEGWSLIGLGLAYQKLGKYDKAIEYNLQALGILREIKNRFGEVGTLDNLAAILIMKILSCSSNDYCE